MQLSVITSAAPTAISSAQRPAGSSRASASLHFIDLEPRTQGFRETVLDGLMKPGKAIPPKFFYDEKGSRLFERLCDSREYYVKRTEIGILRENAAVMAEFLGSGCALFEFGSGASVKTRLLLREMRDVAAYFPIDISRDFLLDSSRGLTEEFPGLPVVAVCADFAQAFTLPEEFASSAKSRAAFFPGSTIGNFDSLEAVRFLKNASKLLGAGGKLLIGVDRLKDPKVLEAAYNDSEGLTAEFNLNLLRRINRELGGTFNLSFFRHKAVFNSKEGRIEMHLESLRDQEVTVAGHSICFHEGETIHTENSYKYAPEDFERVAQAGGFRQVEMWSDKDELFSVYLLEVASEMALAA